jgi:hypothetical protein
VGRLYHVEARGTNFATLEPPAPRAPQRVTATSKTRGERVVVLRPEGPVRDVRATSDPVEVEGVLHVRCCSEEDWYRWAFTGAKPVIQSYPAYLVFVE